MFIPAVARTTAYWCFFLIFSSTLFCSKFNERQNGVAFPTFFYSIPIPLSTSVLNISWLYPNKTSELSKTVFSFTYSALSSRCPLARYLVYHYFPCPCNLLFFFPAGFIFFTFPNISTCTPFHPI